MKKSYCSDGLGDLIIQQDLRHIEIWCLSEEQNSNQKGVVDWIYRHIL